VKRADMPVRNAPVLVFVLSEASPVLAQRWIDEGKLPFLAQMRRNGSAGALQSNFPFVTLQLFADIFTGRRAQQHGVFDFVQQDARGRFHEVDRNSIRCSALWDFISEGQRSSGLVNCPLTWPPRSLNGYMISGQDSPATAVSPRRQNFTTVWYASSVATGSRIFFRADAKRKSTLACFRRKSTGSPIYSRS
jgi:predicted AlkP superfamily phosphohydrolase/phosphomutase